MRSCSSRAAVLSLALAATIAASATAGACDICAIYTGSLMQSDKTGFHAGVAEQYTLFETIREDDREVDNEHGEWVRSSITQLVAGYTFANRIGVQANVPLISREYRRLEEGVVERGDASGLGDVSFLVRASPISRAFSDVLVHAEVIAGLKLPTGGTSRLREELGEHHDGGGDDDGHDDAAHEDDDEELDAHKGASARAVARRPRHNEHEDSAVHGHDLSPGSGSVDGVLGASLHASWRRLYGNISAQYVVRGNGDFSYEYANDLTWEASAGAYLVTQHTWTVSAGVGTCGENKGRDHQKGSLVNDTALTAVYLGPAFAMTWKDDLQASLAIDAPLVQDTTGRQIVADYRLRAGLLWRF